MCVCLIVWQPIKLLTSCFDQQAKCLSDFNFYLSFAIMTCLPVGILIIAFINYFGSIRILQHKLETMTEEQKKAKRKEALHALFELADSDHSGQVDPSELAEILRALGWSIKVDGARGKKSIGNVP